MANMIVIRVLLSWLGTLLLVTGVYAVEEVKMEVGGRGTLKASYTGNPKEINWKLNGNKVVDFEVGKEPNFFRLGDRANISAAGDLTIRNLNLADSGLYKAEVVIGEYIHPTEIRLTVLDCPRDLRISNTTTDTGTVLTCHSSTQDVKYKWVNRTGHVTEGQTYTVPQTRNQDDTVTCIVYNVACSSNISLTIPRTPAANGRLHVGIVVFVAVVIIITIITIVLCRKKISHRIFRSTKADGNKLRPLDSHRALLEDAGNLDESDEPTKPENKEEPEQKRVTGEEADRSAEPGTNVSSPDTLIVETEGDPKSRSCGSITFDLLPVEKGSHLKIRKGDELLFWVEMGKISDDLLKRIAFEHGSFTIRKVPNDETGQVNKKGAANETGQEKKGLANKTDAANETGQDKKGPANKTDAANETGQEKKGPANEIYTFEVHRTDKSPTSHKLPMTGELGGGVEPLVGRSGDGEVILWNADGEVKISLADPRDVTAVVWKKGDDLLLQWHVGDPKLQGEKFALSLSSLTINMEHGDNGLYQVDVHSTDKTVTSMRFHLQVICLKGQKNSRRTEILVKRETPEPLRRGSAEPENVSSPKDPTLIDQRTEDPTLHIASVTLHPVSHPGVISWKKEDTLLVDDQRIHPSINGDLTLRKIQGDDKGKYSVLCDDNLLEEFHLHL